MSPRLPPTDICDFCEGKGYVWYGDRNSGFREDCPKCEQHQEDELPPPPPDDEDPPPPPPPEFFVSGFGFPFDNNLTTDDW